MRNVLLKCVWPTHVDGRWASVWPACVHVAQPYPGGEYLLQVVRQEAPRLLHDERSPLHRVDGGRLDTLG